jgi:hypothetical protein
MPTAPTSFGSTAEWHAWCTFRRNLAADFRLAFGQAPGVLRAMAVMTDGDNNRSQPATWYGEITLY